MPRVNSHKILGDVRDIIHLTHLDQLGVFKVGIKLMFHIAETNQDFLMVILVYKLVSSQNCN